MSGKTLRAGWAMRDATPPLSIPYLGFIPRHAFFKGVHDPLHAKAVALVSETQQVLLLSLDAIGLDNRILGPERDFTAEVRARIRELTGWPEAAVMLTCTHAHSTPETLNFRPLLEHPGAHEWLTGLIELLAQVALQAARSLRPVQITGATSTLEGLATARRAPLYPPGTDLPLDRDLNVLLLTDEIGCRCVLANFACHAVTVQVQPLISADFPGGAMALAETQILGAEVALFFQGADGDVNPPRVSQDFADVERFSQMLGGAVVALAGIAATARPQAPVLATRDMKISLPSRALPSLADSEAKLAFAAEQLAAATTPEQQTHWTNVRRLAKEELVRVRWGEAPVAAEVQVVRIGDTALVGLPGEPFTALGLAIKAQSPASPTLVVGYANGYLGYLAPPEAWAAGGYEVALGPWSRVGSQAPTLLVQTAVELLESLWQA